MQFVVVYANTLISSTIKIKGFPYLLCIIYMLYIEYSSMHHARLLPCGEVAPGGSWLYSQAPQLAIKCMHTVLSVSGICQLECKSLLMSNVILLMLWLICWEEACPWHVEHTVFQYMQWLTYMSQLHGANGSQPQCWNNGFDAQCMR